MFSATPWPARTESRVRCMWRGTELPRFFSWVYPGRVAGMSTPRHARDMDTLVDMGFTHVLTLTAEEPLPAAWLHLKPLEHIFVPVRNYGSPSLGEMDAILAHVLAGGVWLVHCGGGVGRAGTVLACLVAMLGRADPSGSCDLAKGQGQGQVQGPGPGPGSGPTHREGGEPQLDARTAITLLRELRPRSLESTEQEQFVASFVSHRWKTAYAAAPLSEPVAALEVLHPPQRSSGVPLNASDVPTVIFMVGKPGSGKSWLASAIAKRRALPQGQGQGQGRTRDQGRTLIVSQDEAGRAACERALGRAQPNDTLVVVDRCNASRDERAAWLRLVPAGRRRIAVYFDYDAALCIQRIKMRLNHPTVRAGSGGHAVRAADQRMDVPDLDAEEFDAMVVVRSFAAARAALLALTPAVALRKFPRTPHLVNLGAATGDDEVLQGRDGWDMLTGTLTVEEKIDGANMGFTLDVHGALRVQNRSHWVSAADHVQFRALDRWLDAHGAALTRLLARDDEFAERYILYGEWVAATHSVHYTRLPDRFVAFDLYDRLEDKYASHSVLAGALRGSGIPQVPLLGQRTQVARGELLEWISEPSAFSDERREGVYVRFEDETRTHTLRRGKIVRGDFIAGNGHWSKGRIVLNELASSW